MIKHFFFFLFLFQAGILEAQKLRKDDRQLLENLKKHIQYLADDKLEGRRTGTQGEKLAALYITNEFQKTGLSPRGTDTYLQPFEINEGKAISPSTYLSIDGHPLQLHKDFFPLAASPDISFEALPSLSLQEPGMPWFYDLNELLQENATNPHFDINEAIRNSAKQIQKRGGTAVFIYNSSERPDGIQFNGKDRSEQLPIPVVYVNKEAATRFFRDQSASLDLKLKVEVAEKKRSGTNVVGFLDNGAATTVVIGAHFDHLGLGEDGNSREVEKKSQVHNGADDNASGTAALIELARMLKGSKLKNNNYLFVAFSGEELGLYGSKYFTDHSPVDISTINYMINMDMVGRLNDSTRSITVGGYGTSPQWSVIYAKRGRKGLYDEQLQFRFDSSGTGPSDHTSFYLKNIPVLFYFTGLHTDYHKPTDDYGKINYNGQMHVVKHIYSLIEEADRMNQRLVFTKTREAQTTTSTRFSVTLGIMPDYTFSGAGVRVDGVTDNRPGQKAGLKTGDIITALGALRINSLETYMQALSKFKKGDRTKITYNRGSETLSSEVEF